jgi:hypothetical protein
MKKPTVENLARLDASAMAWTGTLATPWTRASGEPVPEVWEVLQRETEGLIGLSGLSETLAVQAVEVEADAGGVTLTVTVGVQNSLFCRMVGKLFDVGIRLESVPQNYGGERWWFVCPVCRTRRAHLYVGPSIFPDPWRCRECLGATYRSRQEHGASSRHGGGMGSVLLMLRRFDARQAVKARRAHRRRFHRRRLAAG